MALGQTKVNGSRVVEGAVNYCADAGVSDDYACSLSPAITSYVAGACYEFKANSSNMGVATVNLNGLGAKVIKKAAGGVATDLSDNDIRAGQLVNVCYDGTNMQVQSGLGNAGADPAAVLASNTLATNAPVLGAANNRNVATGTRSGSTTEFATVSGTKTANKQLAFDASGNIVASSTDIGSGGASGNGTASRGWLYPVPIFAGASSNLNIGTDVVCHRFTMTAPHQSNAIGFNVTTASGVGCTGGTCGFLVGIYDSTKSLIASSEVAYSGHATAMKDINQTGYKKVGWASGSAVSGGVLTLNPGSYWLCYVTDSSTTAFALMVGAGYLYEEQNWSANSDAHGYRAGMRSGNGAGMTLVNTWTGGLALSGGGGGERVVRIALGYE